MKTSKKAISVILAAIMLFSMPLTAYASDGATDKGIVYKALMNTLGFVVEKAVEKIGSVFPVPEKWQNEEDVTQEGLMRGTQEFLDECAEGARFSLGYDSRSLTEGFEVVGNTYVSGGIAFTKKTATSVEDDLRVRTAAITDGSARGISVFLTLDAYGLSLPDVREIRERLSHLTAQKNINSITVSVLHQHSAVDTLGMNGNIWEMALVNPFRIMFGVGTNNGKNREYMERLYYICAESAKAAVENMTAGAMYYGTADQTPYLTDKRAPFVSDPNFNRFRFVPDDGSKETWIVSTEIHCVGNGVQGTSVTADYPYYAEKVINETANANVLFYMGAQQSTSQSRNENTVEDYDENADRMELMKGFGKSIGKALLNISEETEVSPLLNIKYEQIVLPVENPILLLGGKTGMFEAKIVRSGTDKYSVVTEIGYMEIGDEFAFAIIPGELAPELAYGGCLQSEGSWSGEDWEYPSLQQIINAKGKNRRLMVLDLANDQIGYIIPDNNYMPLIAEESDSLELVSLGAHTASGIVEAFEKIVE